MNELSLFTGVGGGVLGSKLLGWKTIGYVEINDYCQKIIKQRIKDCILEPAPIFGDIRAFISEGFAASYTGMVDVISAGFPCQPFSVAGKQQGEDDPRNMWPETIECIRIIRPRFAFMENVPGLLAHPYARRIFGDLAESGYNARWRVLSAAEMGAPHKRDRLWIVADNLFGGRLQQVIRQKCKDKAKFTHDGSPQFVADTTGREDDGRECRKLAEETGRGESINPAINPCRKDVAHCKSAKCTDPLHSWTRMAGVAGNCNDVPDTDSQRLKEQCIGEPLQTKLAATGCSSWWEFEPGLGRRFNGLANRNDRLKALGNGQVPAVVRAVWMLLNED